MIRILDRTEIVNELQKRMPASLNYSVSQPKMILIINAIFGTSADGSALAIIRRCVADRILAHNRSTNEYWLL